MAAVLYEPAFAVVANWFVRGRGRALTVLTFMGGFASVVFVPLAAWLVAAHGWRTALLWLAAILAVLTVPPHALLLRRRPEDHGLAPDGAKPGAGPRRAAAAAGAERPAAGGGAERALPLALPSPSGSRRSPPRRSRCT
jgi:MFS family permease